jgi:hypothetical protein
MDTITKIDRPAPGSMTTAEANQIAKLAEVSRSSVIAWMAGFPMRPLTIRRIERAYGALRGQAER